MSDQPTETQGIFTLDTTSATTTFTISNKIPKQTIYLIGYRIEVTDATAALASPVVYIDLPFLSGNQLIDAIPSRVYLPLMLDNAKVTNWQGLNKGLYLNSDVPNTFDMVVRNGTTFAPLTSLVHICLQWRTTHGALG
jgi:hypothetical protein